MSSYKYNQKLPAKVEKELDNYIERIKAIQWFKPTKLDRATIDKQINVALKAFGVEANIEYRSLKTEQDWVTAWDAAWDAAWVTARVTARVTAWDAARDAARVTAWGVQDLLASLAPKKLGYQEKYPNGNFLQLIPLWEMGLYPCGVIDGKFIVYVPDVPEAAALFDKPVQTEAISVVINGVKYVPEESA